MARAVGIYGFETGHLLSEANYAPASTGAGNADQGHIVGNVSIETSIVHSGSGSLKVAPASGANGYWSYYSLDSSPSVRFSRMYVRITSLPSSNARLLAGVGETYGLKINPDGTLTLTHGLAPAIVGTTTMALTDASHWYRIEFDYGIVSDPAQKLYIDGSLEISNENFGQSGNFGVFGAKDTVADTYTAYFDDIGYDDSSLPGAGRVALLVPVSDSARDTLWTGGAGGTTNLWNAVNNIPPIGTSSETDLTQIEHAGGAAGTTDKYNANMGKPGGAGGYLEAGIGLYSKINGVQPIICSGEDASAGDKLLNFINLSNPTTTNVTNSNIGTGALGVFPSNWYSLRAPVLSSPAIDLKVVPVMTVIRPETASRVASVCFMGIYVDYTPMGENSVNVNQAVNRAAVW